ncbi:MAG: SCO family protein [Chloroflexi bacterium]|nr:SCO family protein [Chloroflexota bacterium]
MRRYALVPGLLLWAGLFAACSTYTFKGAVYQRPAPAPDFALSDTQGHNFRLSDHRGEAVLIGFGYTSCPDVCPLTLAIVKQTFAALGDRAGRVRFAFITVDPGRDTPDVLQAYLARFDPAFVGLTGDPAALAGVFSAYGITVEIENRATPDLSYAVDHTARLYLVDPAGRLRAQYPFGVTADDLRQDIEHVLSEK